MIWQILPAQVALDPEKKITQYSMDSWSIENGMPSNSILDVLNSSSGYMWFATFDGLVRFDGVEFKLYNEKNDPNFKATGTLALFEDHHRNLWIGTNGKGLVRLKGGEFITYYDSEILESNVFLDIEEDESGTLWLGTREGVVKFKDEKFSIDPVLEELQGTPVLDLMFDKSGNLWIGTTGKGVYRLKDGTLTKYSVDDGLNNSSVRTLFQDSNGDILVGSNHGTNIIKKGQVLPYDIGYQYRNTIINEITQDNLGTYWISTDDGLVKVTEKKIEYLTEDDGLPDKTIQALNVDKEGSMWLGTYRGGVMRLKNGKFTNYGEREGLPNNVVNVAYEEDHIIYVGTDYGLGIIENGEISPFYLSEESFGSNRIRDIARGKDGKLWLATYQGLVNFEKDGPTTRYSTPDGLSSEKIRVLEVSEDGVIWIGTGKGLNTYVNGKFEVFDHEELRTAFIMSIFFDSKGRAWIGTDGKGIYLIEGKDITIFDSQNGLASDVVFQISEDKNGLIWVGTNNGISVYNDKDFKSIDFKKGLVSNSVFQILFDWNDEVWITTTQGLQHFNYENIIDALNGDIDQVENSSVYNNFEGMRSRLITGASIGGICSNGTLLIPTVRGLTRIDPANISMNKVIPPVLITEAFLNNEQVFYDDEIFIPNDVINLEINYTGLSLYAPDKVNFRYMLEPFDEDWNDVGTRRTAYYTNIPHGEYVFRVVASNNDGLWNEVGASIKVVKEAYFYEKPWFYLAILVFVASAGYLGYKIRVRNLKLMNQNLLKQVHERTRDIAEQTKAIEAQKEELTKLNGIKDKLFSIISHDLKSPLNSLIGILKLLSVGSLKPEELSSLTSKLGIEVEGLSAMLTNLLSWAKSQMKGINAQPTTIDLEEIVNENIKLIDGDAVKKGITINNHIDNVDAYADKEMMNLIFRNLLSNALKFTNQEGHIDINAKKNGKYVQVSVKDDGVGIPEGDAEKIFSEEEHYSMMGTSKEAGTGLGLLLCKEFIEINGGRIWVESEEGKGSEFIFEIPKFNMQDLPTSEGVANTKV